MTKKLKRQDLRFKVTCVWCGALIRRVREKDADAMCLNCFYRMLKEHLTAQSRSDDPLVVSDR